MNSGARHVLHEALLWGAAAFVALALVYFFDDLNSVFDPNASVAQQEMEAPAEVRGVRERFGGEVRLKADIRGHFIIKGYVNDRRTTFMADTGATLVFLTYENAERLGLTRRLTTPRGSRPDFLVIPPQGSPFFVEVTSPTEDKTKQRAHLKAVCDEACALGLEMVVLGQNGQPIISTAGTPVFIPTDGPIQGLHRIVRVQFGDELAIYESGKAALEKRSADQPSEE